MPLRSKQSSPFEKEKFVMIVESRIPKIPILSTRKLNCENYLFLPATAVK